MVFQRDNKKILYQQENRGTLRHALVSKLEEPKSWNGPEQFSKKNDMEQQ